MTIEQRIEALEKALAALREALEDVIQLNNLYQN